MATLQLLLVTGVLSTDFHYLLEHQHDEPACFAGAFGMEHYHADDDDHHCFIGYHSPTWVDHFAAHEEIPPTIDGPTIILPQIVFEYTNPVHSLHFLRGPPVS